MKILITSGGTKIPIDSVRNISNMSKGTFGSKIATEFLKLGHTVVFLKAKGSITPMSINLDYYDILSNSENINDLTQEFNKVTEQADFCGKHVHTYRQYEYDTFDEYESQLNGLLRHGELDIVLLAAAVSDYGVENYIDGKVRSNDAFNIKLKPLPKLISKVKTLSRPGTKLVGFKLLVDSTSAELLDVARNSLNSNNADMVVANDLSDIRNNNHKISLVFKDKHINYVTDRTDSNFLAKMVVKHSLLL
jgi:phosphopantothenate-cysteine ligase